MIRRHGQPDGFWGSGTTAEATGASKPSRAVQLGQATEQFVFYVKVDGATTITVQVAHSGEPDSDGEGVGGRAPADSAYQNLYWTDKPITFIFSGSGSSATIIPAFTPGWVRLLSSNNINCVAGWEVSSGG